ncbi:hypothetical protein D3C75_1014810 [compost metagenome]
MLIAISSPGEGGHITLTVNHTEEKTVPNPADWKGVGCQHEVGAVFSRTIGGNPRIQISTGIGPEVIGNLCRLNLIPRARQHFLESGPPIFE